MIRKREHDYSSLIAECLKNIGEIKKLSQDTVIIFTISSTVKNVKKCLPYLTPNRFFSRFTVTGCVVFTQYQAKIIACALDGKVDYILVDVEKKIPIGLSAHTDKKSSEDTLDFIESGNVSGEVIGNIKNSKLHQFKANDITVESIWIFLEKKIGNFSGKKIAILGGGNIGSKIALKLVESGCHVSIYRRNIYKGQTICQALNLIKPESTISKIEYEDSILKACFLADVVIGCTNGIPIINQKCLKLCRPNVICIDTGKGTFSSDSLQYLANKKINVYRTDISASLEGYITALLRNNEILGKSCGRGDYQGFPVVSGGLLGHDGEIVVNNYRAPTVVLGVANGKGDLKINLSSSERNKINSMKKIIKGNKG